MAEKMDVETSDTTTEEVPEEKKEQSPLLKLAIWKHELSTPDSVCSPVEKKETKARLLKHIQENDMAPYYERLCKNLNWTIDEKLLETMKQNNTKKLADLNDKVTDAKKNLGDTEIREILLLKADYLANIGDEKAALAAYQETYEKTVGIGRKIDLVLSNIRLALAYDDLKLAKEQIGKAKALVEEGGDWERRNLLGVYEATYLVMTREFKEAAELFLKSIATFTATELFSYETLIFYTVLVSIQTLDRVTLRDKVIRSPEILTVIRDIPHLKPFLFSLYECKYSEFFQSLAQIITQVKRDRYFSPHVEYFVREVRVVAYSQFLESYRSVTFKSMASAFGLSVPFLDRELSRFIAAGRLNCKIDKVGGIVETNRPDARNMQYQAMIKQGDILLNRIQNLQKLLSHSK